MFFINPGNDKVKESDLPGFGDFIFLENVRRIIAIWETTW